MDWSRTKMIFIVAFLLLNAFLLYQLIEKKNASELNVRAQATVRERLANMNVQVTENLPDERSEISHIVGKSVDIQEEVTDKVGEENVHAISDKFIEVKLEEPFEVSSDVTEDVTQFMNEYVWNAEEYTYDRWNSNDRQMFFNQMYEEQTVYTYGDDQLVLFFNEDNEIESYVQSYLIFDEEGKAKDMLPPYRAIDVLLRENILSFNDYVSKVNLGYHSLFSSEGEDQVFAPMYRIEINEEKTYLIHAIDGSIQDMDEESNDNSSEEKTDTGTGEAENN
ncbi:Two-component signal transduction system YycFG, regulatory protein YycI [Alteribacillus persepolensis]|uniref:Two-component signal transduction system YycFG, regulatory protein YycI n=1 Tax=Alteribacillus persepolensis TaxID=568899 RepID=A0A1G8G7V3_9BACI|nr:two-component system regulatory protein YycI [Alteribacillus persepolensis]SDH90433.1 Two-component signal transduction system YycFG, regulatory protein YycI [Alteribacillus persepolensis]